MLPEILNKIKAQIAPYKDDLFIALIIVLVAVIGFGLGRLSAIYDQKEPIRIEYGVNQTSIAKNALSGTNLEVSPPSEEKLYVASKNSDKYHFPWCSGAKRIKESNKMWFSSKEEAEGMGFKPAGNCEGL